MRGRIFWLWLPSLFTFLWTFPSRATEPAQPFPALFGQPISRQASASFAQRRYKQAAELAGQALVSSAPKSTERPYLQFLRFLAFSRIGKFREAREAMQALFAEGVPADLSSHANWYQVGFFMRRPGTHSPEEMARTMLHLEKIPPVGRFSPAAHTLAVHFLFAAKQTEEGCVLANRLAEQWMGEAAESEAALLQAECQVHMSERFRAMGNAREAANRLAQAAGVYREISLWWPTLRAGGIARSALKGLKRQGVKPAALDLAKNIARIQHNLKYRIRSWQTLALISRIHKDALPFCRGQSACYQLVLLKAGVAKDLRSFARAAQTFRQVAREAPDPEQRARAEMGLADLLTRRNGKEAIRAFLSVERRWPQSSVAPVALYEAGELLRRSKRDLEAFATFQRCAVEYPDHPGAVSCAWALGWKAYRDHALHDAALFLQDLLVSSPAVVPPDSNGSYLLDSTFREDGFLGSAAESAEGIPEIDGRGDGDGGGDFGDGGGDGGARTEERAPEVDPFQLQQKARYWFGRTAEERGEPEIARRIFRDLTVDHPFSYYALLAWERQRSLGQAEGTSLTPGKTGQSARGKGPAKADPPHPEVLAASAYLRMGLTSEARKTLSALRPNWLSRGDRRLASQIIEAMGLYQQSHRMAPVPWEGGLLEPPQGEARLDAELSYPRAFAAEVEGPLKSPTVPKALFYALMRMESGFNPSAHSVAQALGLTQVVRGTARQVARTLGMPHFRFRALLNPATSVQIGSAFLGQLLRHFEGNPVLAVAAYNAGEAGVRRWRIKHRDVPMDVFVEEIPYDETSRYVRNVLTAYAIYKTLYETPESAFPAVSITQNIPLEPG